MAEWIFENDNIEINRVPEGVPVSVLKIMKRRGVPEGDFEDFLSEAPKKTYDPFLLPDMRQSCEALIKYCDEGRAVCVYGDYDADGVTATTLMVSLLKHFSKKISYYIPSRFEDGYGPNNAALQRIRESGADVLVTVDCGITSAAEMDFAESIGLKTIVTDHHIIREGMTPSGLVVNPHRPESRYPYSELSGCGVAFKVAQGVQRICAERGDERFTRKDLCSFLDLVAISTVADVVPLLDENRLLVKYGLGRINKQEREGLVALLSELSLDIPVDASKISFAIAPNINAMGRMGRADGGVELLESVRPLAELKGLASEIAETNRKRKAVQEETADICRRALKEEDCGDFAPIIYAPGAHEGVAGIVAGSLKEEMNRPICIVSPSSDGTLKGTGRSIPGINMHELFEKCGDVFTRFGGHAGACGFTVKPGKLEEFRAVMQRLVEEEVKKNPDILNKKLYIEKELSSDEKNIKFAETLKKLEPFGEANPVPLFCIKNAKVINLRHIGSEGQHISLTIKSSDGISVSCIAFRGAEYYKDIVQGSIIDTVGELGINEYRGRRYLQFKIADIRKTK